MSHALTIGDMVPDYPLTDASGGRSSLQAFSGEATALIFLRHLG